MAKFRDGKAPINGSYWNCSKQLLAETSYGLICVKFVLVSDYGMLLCKRAPTDCVTEHEVMWFTSSSAP